MTLAAASTTTSTPAPGVAIELAGGARALFTARAHGNLSSVGGAGREDGLRSRERLRAECGVRGLLRAYQVHGADVAVMRRGDPDPPRDSAEQPSVRADGWAVATPGVAAMAMAADCLPVALATAGAVAAVHAGWRGIAAGVLERGVRALRELGGHGEIVAVVGPGAGACCYEVGEEVHAAFGSPGAPGTPIDLRAIAHRRLRAAGVTRVGDVAACTICDERFFSHRREGAAAGRQAGLAWLT